MPVHQLDRIGVVSVAKMYAAVSTVMSLLYAIPLLLFGSAFDFGFGLGMSLGIVVVGAIGGFISGAIGALVYNLVAGTVGGVELHLSSASSGAGNQTNAQRTDADLD